MQDRLAELRRQRALIAEHLAWLDREIDAALFRPTAPVPPPALVAPTPAFPPPVVPPAIPGASPLDATAILSAAANKPASPQPPEPAVPDPHGHLLPQRQPTDIKDDVRRGCLLYVAIGALLLIGLGALLVWASREYKKDHPPAPPAAKQDPD